MGLRWGAELTLAAGLAWTFPLRTPGRQWHMHNAPRICKAICIADQLFHIRALLLIVGFGFFYPFAKSKR
jgi:hypothetical protein